MPSTPSKGSRSRWGMARHELETNYDKIQPIVADTPNYTAAYEALVTQKLITVTYSAFVRVWKRITNERAKPAEAKADEVSPAPKGRKPLPPVTGFKMPTGSDEVDKAW